MDSGLSDCREIPFGGHFLSLNIRYGVIPYVAARATPRCLIQKASMSDGLDLSDGLKPDSFQFVTTQLYPFTFRRNFLLYQFGPRVFGFRPQSGYGRMLAQEGC